MTLQNKTRTSVFFICLFLGVSISLNASSTTIRLKNHAEAIKYLPKNYNPNKRYPILMALHGLKESPLKSLKHFKSVADTLNMILICPEGQSFQQAYLRGPIDDRKNFVNFLNLVATQHKINKNKSILVGFSRGGNFAIETALKYPHKFKNVISYFGFFNNGVERIPQKKLKQNPKAYKNTNIYFYSGHGDQTLNSNIFGRRMLGNLNIKSRLFIDKHLNHNFPQDLIGHIKKTQTWMKILP